VIIGIPLGIMFSGGLVVQCILYFRSARSRNTWRMSSVVIILIVLDLLHDILLWASAWQWCITERGLRPDFIPIPLALAMLVTAITTFIAHAVYWWRIFRFSGHNYWISLPIIFLAVLRVVASIGTTMEMIVLQSFGEFRSKIAWVFSVGLALSSTVDLSIAGVMMIILRKSRKRSLSLNSVIDSLVIWTFETGSVTAIVTIASLICWLVMDNLIFLSLHFVIAKLYANSVVAMLNYRESLNQQQAAISSRSPNAVVEFDAIRLETNPSTQWQRRLIFPCNGKSQSQSTPDIGPMELQVNVTKTMRMHTDEGLMEESKRDDTR